MIPLFKVMNAPTAVGAIAAVLESGYIGEGPKTAEFETVVGERLGCDVTVLNSGTSALWLAYVLAGVGPGSEVISTPLTCLATNAPVTNLGATIRWADVNPNTGMIDPESVMDQLRDNTKAIVAVDWGGSLADLWTLRCIADAHGVWLIEDAAHAFGHRDRYVSDAVVWSFQAIKHLTTGDGGALHVASPPLRDRARLLRWFGLDRSQGASMRCYQQVAECGYKFQMNDIAAALGLANLPTVNQRIAQAQANARVYDQAFEGTKIRPLDRGEWSACWLYTVRVPSAQDFIRKMADCGVECSQVHARNDTQQCFRAYPAVLPGMDQLEREMVCLPVGPWVDRDAVIESALGSIA